MKLTNIKIRGLRAIENLNLDLSPGINVFAGVNGAGKSSLLYAIELALSWAKARLRSKNANGSYPGQFDINQRVNVSSIMTSAVDGGDEFTWTINRYLGSYRKIRVKSDFIQLTTYADRKIEEYSESEGMIPMPMFVKYSVNRSLIDVPVKVHKKHRLDMMDIYEEPLDAGLNLRSFFEWFREREDIENELKVQNHRYDFEDNQLSAVRRALALVFPEYREMRTRRRKPAGFVLRKGDEELRVDQLSDGEKCYMTLIGDIARRLAIFNPMGDPLKGEGIILIDELELHLHPKWQGEAIDRLREVFPNCQFFITTHSPHIVQNLHLYPGQKDTFIALKKGEDMEVTTSYGVPVNDVLINIFELDSLRPAMVHEVEKEIWRLLAERKEDSDEFREKEQRLRDMLKADDPLFSKIKAQKIINSRLPR